MKSFFDPVSGRRETVEITPLGEGGGHRFRNARSGFSRYPLENRTCYQCGQKGHLSANCLQQVRRVSVTEGSIKYEGAGETQLRLRLQSNMGSIPQHEPQEDDARPEDSASQVGAHQFLGTMSTLGVGEPGRARKRRTSCTVERFPLFAEIQARDTVTSHAASTAATARDTAQAAGEVLTRPSTRCGCEFRCCCKFCRKARAYEAKDASKEPACEEASRENHDKAY